MNPKRQFQHFTFKQPTPIQNLKGVIITQEVLMAMLNVDCQMEMEKEKTRRFLNIIQLFG